MLFFSHLAATLFLILAAQKFTPVDFNAIIFTIIAGVLIDFDHIFYPKKSFIAAKEFILKKQKKEMYTGSRYVLHSYLQEPIFVFVLLIIASVIFFTKNASWVIFLPVIALSLHIIMDSLMVFRKMLLWPFSKKEFKGFLPSNTKLEFIIDVIALGFIVVYVWRFCLD